MSTRGTICFKSIGNTDGYDLVFHVYDETSEHTDKKMFVPYLDISFYLPISNCPRRYINFCDFKIPEIISKFLWKMNYRK